MPKSEYIITHFMWHHVTSFHVLASLTCSHRRLYHPISGHVMDETVVLWFAGPARCVMELCV